MRLYFRSDTRPPAEIFEQGFKPQALNADGFVVDESLSYEEALSHWSMYSVINPLKHMNSGQATDAYSPGGVCLSTSFEATAMFPSTSSENCYIYVIALPEPKQIHLEDFSKQTYEELRQIMIHNGIEFDEMSDERYGSKASTGAVYDLHNLQLQQVMDLVEQGKITNMQQLLKAAWTLYAYEAVTSEVRPENIIMGVKCTGRRRLRSGSDELAEEDFSVSFRLDEVVINHECNVDEDIRDEASLLVFSMKKQDQQELRTPSIGWGLGGKILPSFNEIEDTAEEELDTDNGHETGHQI